MACSLHLEFAVLVRSATDELVHRLRGVGTCAQMLVSHVVFCSSAVNAACCGMIVSPLCVWKPRNSLRSRTFLLSRSWKFCVRRKFLRCSCLQDDLARGFAVFQSSLRFRRIRQRKHFINVQTEPALANPFEHIVRAPQQFFARSYEMAEHPA